MATTDYYPSAGDGFGYYNNVAWATARDSSSAAGVVYNTVEDWMFYIKRQASSTYYLYRSFYPFDTSGIGSGNTVSDAVLHFYIDGSQYINNVSTNLHAVESTQASTTVLAASDWSKITFSSIGSTAWGGTTPYTESITLNATGEAFVNTTGHTKIAIICEEDLTDTPPTVIGNPSGTYTHYSEDTSNEAFIRVTYAAASTANNSNFFQLM